ncbi:N-6 DNA methylase [Bacillus cytotoxicus]|nr:N-6 DNA methylase [Bacillus cytotoxicus]
MNNNEIVSKLWGLANVLRDDGITYQQYVTELTYILFLKMMKEQETESVIPEGYRWDDLLAKEGIELKEFYQALLLKLGSSETENERLRAIYSSASTSIDEPKNLEKLIKSIDELDWYNAKEEGLGDLYEGLLEKNASEKKSGAGQYFTPRVLIDVMVELIDPKPGEKLNDPAAGTFGFMIAADRYLKEKTDDYFELTSEQAEFQKKEAFTGMELVKDTHRLALMNALLHDIEGPLEQGDTLSANGKWMKNFDVVLTNPPFGTKKGGERATRDDLTFETLNKQLNFLQVIYNSLKKDGNARAAVVLPDNVLSNDTIGSEIRRDLMNKCNLHTILRLPKGIFYAKDVSTNILFFERGKSDSKNTEGVYFYDLRSNMPSFGVRTPLVKEHLKGFVNAYSAKDRSEVDDPRWTYYSREEISKNGDSLDLGIIEKTVHLITNNNISTSELIQSTISNLDKAIIILKGIDEKIKRINLSSDLTEKNNDNKVNFEFKYDIPASWKWVKITEVLKKMKNIDPAKLECENFHYIDVDAIDNKNHNLREYKIVPVKDAPSRAKRVIDKNDVLISLVRPYLKNIALIDFEDGKLIGSTAFYVCKCNELISPEYLYYYLLSNTCTAYLKKYTKGDNSPSVRTSDFEKLYVPLPPISEQLRRVKEVNDIFKQIDEVIELTNNEEIMNELKKSILAKVLGEEL